MQILNLPALKAEFKNIVLQAQHRYTKLSSYVNDIVLKKKNNNNNNNNLKIKHHIL